MDIFFEEAKLNVQKANSKVLSRHAGGQIEVEGGEYFLCNTLKNRFVYLQLKFHSRRGSKF